MAGANDPYVWPSDRSEDEQGPPDKEDRGLPDSILMDETAELSKRRRGVEDNFDFPPTDPVRAGVGDLTEEDAKALEESYQATCIEAEQMAPGASGLALSGGGIRSAVFNLGVLQALAKANLLRYFDYLSTVSGGGYIGASLTWYSARAANKAGAVLGDSDFVYGTDDPSEHVPHRPKPDERNPLEHLRRRGKYLIPGKGITLTSGVAIVLRGILLNLLVWFPIAVCIFGLLLYLGPHLKRLLIETGWSCDAMFLICGLQPDAEQDPFGNAALDPHMAAFNISLNLATGLAIVFLAFCAVYSVATFWARSRSRKTVPGDLPPGGRSPASWYMWRRRFEKWVRPLLWLFCVFVVLGVVPYVEVFLSDENAEATSALSLIAGAISGLFAFSRSQMGKLGKLPAKIAGGVGATLFLFGFTEFAFQIARYCGPYAYDLQREIWGADLLMPWVVGLIAAMVTGLLVNLNYISLHRFYRDRLMEAFLPDTKGAMVEYPVRPPSGARTVYHRLLSFVRAGSKGGTVELTDRSSDRADQADEERLSTVWTDRVGPYPLVNTNLVLVDSDNRTHKLRGGDGFLLSPLYCGSYATGWRSTNSFMSDGMTLASAMAISGAAAHPNAGVGGKGVTRSPVVSLLMALLNLRLGYWITNPKLKQNRLSKWISHFHAAYYELGPAGYNEDRKRLQISDGGHFENLGLYELVRRQCRLVVVCDAGADKEYSFSDLQVAIRRCAADFNAKIAFPDGLEGMIPQIESQDFPKGIMLAKQGHAVGTIRYDDGSSGTIVLMKTTMIEGLSLLTRGYKVANRDFPDQTTADQFFDEEQFEAYRELGYQITKEMLADPNTALHARIKALWAKPLPGVPPA